MIKSDVYRLIASVVFGSALSVAASCLLGHGVGLSQESRLTVCILLTAPLVVLLQRWLR